MLSLMTVFIPHQCISACQVHSEFGLRPFSVAGRFAVDLTAYLEGIVT